MLDVTSFAGNVQPLAAFTWGDFVSEGSVQPSFPAPTRHVDATSSLAAVVGYELLMSWLYITLAWYFGQVFSGGNDGAALPWYFPCDATYWGLRDARVAAAPRDAADDGDTLARLQAQSAAEQCAVVHKVSKAYETKVTAARRWPNERSLTLGS